MKNILAVYDTDEDYGRQLADYVNRKENSSFRIKVFTEWEKLKAYADENTIDVLLASESITGDQLEGVRAGKHLILTEDKKRNMPQCICKYQSAGELMRELALAAGHKQYTEDEEVDLQKVSVLGVFSPVGRCGKTSFALLMGQVLARNRSVLYISLEEFPSVWELFAGTEGGSLSDAIFYYSQGILTEHMKELTGCWHDLHILRGVGCPEDISGMSGEKAEGLIREIAGTGFYEVIVIDMGSSVNVAAELFRICSSIYLVLPQEDESREKLELFDRWADMQRTRGSELVFTQVRLPAEHKAGNLQMQLEYMLWNRSGDYVRELVRGQW